MFVYIWNFKCTPQKSPDKSFRKNYNSNDFQPYPTKKKDPKRLCFNQKQAEKYTQLLQKEQQPWKKLSKSKKQHIGHILNIYNHNQNQQNCSSKANLVEAGYYIPGRRRSKLGKRLKMQKIDPMTVFEADYGISMLR